MTISTSCLGFPRMGAERELKFALESYWSGKSSLAELQKVAADLRARHWQLMQTAGISVLPCNDFSYYDQVLDTAVLFGAVPAAYRGIQDPHQRYFAMARGFQDQASGADVPALAMKKWFDTNYHYIVPELEAGQNFELHPEKLFQELEEARALGLEARPVLIGPVTFLKLSRTADDRPYALLDGLLKVYGQLLKQLADKKVAWVQLDEPCLVTDLSADEKAAYRQAFAFLGELKERPKLMVTTYFGDLEENLDLVLQYPLDGLHVDRTRSHQDLWDLLQRVPESLVLSLGLVDGRNIWRCDLDAAYHQVIEAARKPGRQLLIATSCSLLHSPVSLRGEKDLDPEVKNWMAFAEEKLAELAALGAGRGKLFDESRQAQEQRKASQRVTNPQVRARTEAVSEAQAHRVSEFAKRREVQLTLPLLPTTTIGSFPQTQEIRSQRAAHRQGKISDEQYQEFLRNATADCIRRQEALGLDVLVHGEYERNDMVEYFGEKLHGFVFTRNGWVQSYGSRCVKPPVLFGDVERKHPMTVEWASYAQSLTSKPVKGMLTGPVTILQWSFVRTDQPRSLTCLQLALALRDEVCDLEKAGIRLIQVDEPAIREGLPLRRNQWEHYLEWAVNSFRIATSGVADATQIHTHMCYSEFEDILPSVAALDADVLFIETARSRMESLAPFADYPNAIGPGVYDIHSPRVPSVAEMADLLREARRRVDPDRLWVNPDCGLKTRGWREVEMALEAMVEAARQVRAESESLR
ncbi:MAG: 5-methyltetrahydropteroyltriglutamate--homocysteine S-methyltransferase [Candidatus Eremiobacteraeota bacterium]|nr:5-methyltetrahydropteroyltriglutamate--homocysteine S-methyltransferase [Candidatus Eremiobacteraeota bacterium]MCW5869268.1 5-methyltetrahydropteroyltriglutamate--homocysteine S-methyltransferase [Candidatus Eremiobacteraeota bacterium]